MPLAPPASFLNRDPVANQTILRAYQLSHEDLYLMLWLYPETLQHPTSALRARIWKQMYESFLVSWQGHAETALSLLEGKPVKRGRVYTVS